MNLVETNARELARNIEFANMEIENLEDQIKELQNRKRKLQTQLDAGKDKVREGMAENGISRIEVDGYLFRLDPPTQVLNITDESLIDKKFIKTTTSIDKSALKKAIKDEGPQDGAELVDGKHRLAIKELE